MFDISHDVLVWFSKSAGLAYFICMSIGAVLYAYWPSNGKVFKDAADVILRHEDTPWQ